VLAELDVGSEVLDVLVMQVGETLSDLQHHEDMDHTERSDTVDEGAQDAATASAIPKRGGNATDSAKPPRYKRLLLWSHHLLATGKRKSIVSWSRELDLAGFSRPGYPGAVFVEGLEGDVDEFVKRMKALRWQALQVRAEETGTERLFFGGHERGGSGEIVGALVVEEVESLGDIAEALRRQAGKNGERLAEFFLSGMKITGSASDG